MNTIIRLMKIEDKEEVCKMMKIFYESAAVDSNGSKEIFENDVASCLDENCPFAEGYVFENEKGILGYGMLAKSFSTEFGKLCIWVEDLYLKPEARGLSIGKLFLETVNAKYPEAIKRLEVEKENVRAVKLYESCGYEYLPYSEMILK